jgi:predicted permease
MTGLVLDIRVALRRLARRPGSAIVFIGTIALGLASAATAAGVVRALLLRPLPFSTLDRLVLVRDDLPVSGVEQRAPVTPVDIAALRAQASAFEQVAAFRFRTRTMGSGVDAEQLRVAETSASFWPALDIRPLAGRTFGSVEETPGQDGVVVLNETFWRERLAGSPAVGRSVRIDGRPFSVIGIVSARYPLGVDVWVPLALSPAEWDDGAARNLQALALLKPHVSVPAAEADVRRVGTSLAATYPDTHRGRNLRLLPLRAEQYEFTLGLFSLVQIVALGVLLVAATNAITIMTVNVLDARAEASVRAALGASVVRVVRPFALEAAILSGIAGLLAILITGWTVPLVQHGVPAGIAKWIAGWDAVRPDASLALATWCTAAAVGVGIGVWSGFRGARGSLVEAMATGARTLSGRGGKGREVALGLQTSISIVLLSAAVLFSGGLADVRLGFRSFDPDRVLLARATASAHQYPAGADVVSFFQRSSAAAAALPGVLVAGLIQNAPASNVPNQVLRVWPVEEPPADGDPAPAADLQIADPRGLAALAVGLVQGRSFLDSDTAAAARVALVSRQLAVRLWGARDPIGRVVATDAGSSWRVVGVVQDIRLNWYDGGPRPTLYLPHAQTAARAMTFVVRCDANPESLAAALGEAVRRVETDPPPLRMYTLRAEVDESLAPLLTLAWLLGALSLVALALSTAGIYGLAASAVALRTREMAIRVVLGAGPRSLVHLVVRTVARPVGVGCIGGVVAAIALASWLGARTFGLLALEPEVPIAIGVLLMAAAAVGAWNPARRAARVDPVVALRG